MTLVEKIQKLKTLSGNLRLEMRDACVSKGVSIPEGTVPSLNGFTGLVNQILIPSRMMKFLHNTIL